MHGPASELPIIAAEVLARLRAQKPRVHCITNAVAQVITANTLLAVGALPSMTIAPEEVPAFVKRAGAVLVNLGTFDAERRTASGTAIAAARSANIPWCSTGIHRSFTAARDLRQGAAHAQPGGDPAQSQ